MKQRQYILPVIILSQFTCTSLWFAGNAIIDEIAIKTGLGDEIIGHVLSAVQLGFIVGTLVFALLMIADRFPPSKVFLVCSILAAASNLALLIEELYNFTLLSARFGTGFFLAGIYPIGMKIAADYYEKGLGKALGFLVGALVFGTALPYFISGSSFGSNPDMVIKTVSSLSVFGGILLFVLVPNGPFRKPSTKLQLNSGAQLFKITDFRKAALGYFGHMWELYAFWAFTPLAIQTYNEIHTQAFSIPLYTGIFIALGGVSCSLGGLLSEKLGSKKVAIIALLISGMFCVLSPFMFELPSYLFLLGWGLWGMAVTADSPQLSNLVADSIPNEFKGTGLTLATCIGFAISIVSIQLLSVLTKSIHPKHLFLILAIGPILGLIALIKKSS